MKPCLRCGSFVAAPRVADLPFCAACLEERPVPPSALALTPPRRVVLARLRLLLLFMGPGGLLGVLLGSFVAPGRGEPWFFPALFGGLVGTVAGELLSMLVAFQRVLNAGRAVWKDEVRAKLGLEHLPASACGWAFFAPAKTGPFQFRSNADPGLLFESAAGVVFLGSRGTRVAVDFARDVVDARVESIDPIVLRGAARLALRDGRSVYLAPREHSAHGANRRHAEELVARARAARAAGQT